jgi:hypothetical protein
VPLESWLRRTLSTGREVFTGARRHGATWRATHWCLLDPIEPGPQDRRGTSVSPDAIVVPTARPDPHLRPGIRLALELGRDCRAPVVLLCTQHADEEFGTNLAKLIESVGDVQVLVLTVAREPSDLTSFAVDGLPMSRAYRGVRGVGVAGEEGRLNDVGRKRNLALLLARAMHWRHVLFLDDDVFPRDRSRRAGFRRNATLDRATLSAAVRGIESGSQDAVGWLLRDFDDNSVLHRLRAEFGRLQDQFVSGGALLVRVDTTTPFFPLIYNEDWLFVLGYGVETGVRPRIAVAGEVGQEPYEAYTRLRARAEEFGDILGEGWATRAEKDHRFWEAEPAFWRHAFRERIRLRGELQSLVAASSGPATSAMTLALEAVEKVQRVLGNAYAGHFAQYGRVWRDDLRAWAGRFEAAASMAPTEFATGDEFVTARVAGTATDLAAFVRHHDRRTLEPAVEPVVSAAGGRCADHPHLREPALA